MGECGLSYNILSDKTYAYKSENCSGGKCSKEQLSILVGANMEGRENFSILVIGKLKNLKCFLNVKALPCEYDSNKNV